MMAAAVRASIPGRHDAPLTATDIFKARCAARALLYRVGALELHESVDILQYAAVRTGLVDQVGQDAVQAIMADAFKQVRS